MSAIREPFRYALYEGGTLHWAGLKFFEIFRFSTYNHVVYTLRTAGNKANRISSFGRMQANLNGHLHCQLKAKNVNVTVHETAK